MAEPLYRKSNDVMVLGHWKAYRPDLVRALKKQGKLQQVLHEVADRVGAVETSALASGLSLDAAQELGNLEFMDQIADYTPWALATYEHGVKTS